MKRALAGAVLIICVALYFNHSFLSDATPPSGHFSDHQGIMAGYQQITSFSDTLEWWHGPWINSLYPSLRPVSSYLHWLQVWAGTNYGWTVTAWITFSVFAAVCLMVAALAWQLTKSHWLALLAGLLASNIGTHVTDHEHGPGLNLAWYAISDNLLACSLMLASLTMFLKWRETNKRSHIIASWVLMISAILSKELALMAPSMILLLALLPGAVARKIAVLQAVGMGGAACVLFAFRSVMILGAHDAPHSRLDALDMAVHQTINHYMPPSPLEIVLLMSWGDALLSIIGYALAGAAFYSRRPVWAVLMRPSVALPIMQASALWGALQLSYLPVLGFPFASHYTLAAAFLSCVFSAVAVMAAVQFTVALIEAIQANAATRCEIAAIVNKADRLNSIHRTPDTKEVYPSNVDSRNRRECLP